MAYFAYSTWLDERELRTICPEARLIGRATASNSLVEFRAPAGRTDRGWCTLTNIATDGVLGHDTLGLLYELDEDRFSDRLENFDISFITVRGDDGIAYDCFTYTMTTPGAKIRPPDFYWARIARGLRAWEFPADYIASIERTYLEAEPCPDADRPEGPPHLPESFAGRLGHLPHNPSSR